MTSLSTTVPQAKRCQSCAENIKATAIFCTSCGVKQETSSSPEQGINSPFFIRSSLQFAWDTLSKRIGLLLALHFAIGGIPALGAFFIQREPYHSILQTGLQMFLMGGFLSVLLTIVDGGKPRFSDLFSKANLFWRYALAYVFASALWGLGFILLVVPGIIATLHTCFYGLCIVDDDLGPIEAFKRSSQLTKGCRWKLLGFFGVLLATAIPIALFSALVFAIPAALLYFALHIQLKHLIAFELSSVVPGVLIFWELAWVHCYRQLTQRYARMSGFAENRTTRRASQRPQDTLEELTNSARNDSPIADPRKQMVRISAEDSDFRKALAAFLFHEQGVKIDQLSEEQFEEIGNNVRKKMSGDDAEITNALWFRAARHQRLTSQWQGNILFWLGLNAYLFWGIGFQHLLSWQAALWLVVGTGLFWSIVGFLGALLEGLVMLFGLHYKLFRGIKYLTLFFIIRPLFNLVFLGKL